MFHVNLSDHNISSLYGWDFSEHTIQKLDLSHNQLRTIDDRVTNFCFISNNFDLSHNQIRSVHLNKTVTYWNRNEMVLKLANNKITAKSFAANHIFIPQTLKELDLSNNPIGSISNYNFCVSGNVILENCGISSLENMIFCAKRVSLKGNPLDTMRNITFKNVHSLDMSNCNLSISMLVEFGMFWIAESDNRLWPTVVDLKGNNITVNDLVEADFDFPDTSIDLSVCVDDGQYRPSQGILCSVQ